MTGPVVENPEAVREVMRVVGVAHPPRLELVEAVMPVVPFESPAFQRLAVYGGAQGPTAGNNSHVQIFNPATSGVDLHVDTALATSSAAGVVAVNFYNTACTTLAGGLWRDRRLAGQPVGQVRRQDNAGALGTTLGPFIRILANTTYPIPLDVYLGPGQGILLVHQTVNSEMRVSFYWEEVPRGTDQPR